MAPDRAESLPRPALFWVDTRSRPTGRIGTVGAARRHLSGPSKESGSGDGGGRVDTQHTLPFGTPQEVRREVLARLGVFAPGGGFVFNTIHNLQPRTPVANLLAMFDAIREFNG